MDRDYLYFHFANLGLVLIGLLSVQQIAGPIFLILLIPGTICGFIVSWQIREHRPQHLDTFIGMLSLASVVVTLSRLYDTSVSLDNMLKIFSTTLMWLTLFQSFGIRRGKGYAMLQFISVCLLIASVGLALEREIVYIAYLAIFLFILLFTMRLGLLCEKKRKGSLIVGNQEEVMGLWQQTKVGAVMFSLVLIVASLIYPMVPRFENLSLKQVPSTLFGWIENNPLLMLLQEAKETVKEDKKAKVQPVDDKNKKRETKSEEQRNEDRIKDKPEKTARFPAKDFNKSVDIFKIDALTIRVDKKEVALDDRARLSAELKMNDGSVIPASKLVDWKVSGTAKVEIDRDANLIPKEEGAIQISATYMGSFSNDLNIKIKGPVKPVKKRPFWFYPLIFLWWLLLLGLTGVFVWVFSRSRKLSEMARVSPRDFSKEVYRALCRGFKAYGVPRFNYVAYREFLDSVKEFISARPEPMRAMTEKVMEARFSTHEISEQHSKEVLGLFHEARAVVMEKEVPKGFFRRIMLNIFMLDVLLISR